MNKCKLAIFFGIAIYSGVVIAQASTLSPGPSWEVIAVGTWGLLTTVVGAVAMTWTAAISSRIKDQEVKLSEVNDRIRDRYHDKDELREVLLPIKEQLAGISADVSKMRDLVSALHGRLDALINNGRA